MLNNSEINSKDNDCDDMNVGGMTAPAWYLQKGSHQSFRVSSYTKRLAAHPTVSTIIQTNPTNRKDILKITWPSISTACNWSKRTIAISSLPDLILSKGTASIAFNVECPVGLAAASRQQFDRWKPKPVLAVKNMLNISKDKICNDVSSTFHHLYALLNIW